MNRYFTRYLDKFCYSFIDWLFRKKTLNYILYISVLFAFKELSAISAGEGISEFISTIQERYPDGCVFWAAGLSKVVLGQGSLLVLGITFLVMLLIVNLKRTELIQATSGEQFGAIIEELKEKNLNQQQALENLELDQEQLEFKKNELKKFLDKVNDTLQAKNISKEELIRKVSNKLKAILIYKSYENPPKTIRDEIYPAIGVQNISSGLSMIPPQKLDQHLSDQKLIEWFKSTITENLPEDYEYNFSLIAVVDLTKMAVLKKLEPYRRFNRTFLDRIRVEDLLPLREIESYLFREEKISSKQIIEIPNITFLIEDYIVTKEELERLFKNNDTIINQVREAVDSDQLITTDFAIISNETISAAIEPYVENPEEVTEAIKRNAQFWKDYFDGRIES
ncbi:MAG: hypothetical protein ABFS32_17335 [Bacteroidota bacterium]